MKGKGNRQKGYLAQVVFMQCRNIKIEREKVRKRGKERDRERKKERERKRR